jgi:hypothetical protein
MNKDLYDQILANLDAKETEELVKIWQTNDRSEWPRMTFVIIQNILRGRLGELPPQNKPIRKLSKKDEEYIQNAVQLERVLNEENPPEFYNPRQVLKVDKCLYKAAIVLVIVTVIKGLLNLETTQSMMLSYLGGAITSDILSWILAVIFFILTTGIYCVVAYLVLTSLGSIMKILMGMEFNSRDKSKTRNL